MTESPHQTNKTMPPTPARMRCQSPASWQDCGRRRRQAESGTAIRQRTTIESGEIWLECPLLSPCLFRCLLLLSHLFLRCLAFRALLPTTRLLLQTAGLLVFVVLMLDVLNSNNEESTHRVHECAARMWCFRCSLARMLVARSLV